nr:RNA demethylase ALKBH5-like [Leptinotarsa decemlineata]
MHCNEICDGAQSFPQNTNKKSKVKLSKLQRSIQQVFIFSENDLKIFESHVDTIVEQGRNGVLKEFTVDHTLLRQKYFFGERYTYGAQSSKRGLGTEKLYPENSVDQIPKWIINGIINPLVAAEIIPENFVNSVVINDYMPGGCIVSHIDPPQIFDRPIVSLNLFSDSALCFGCKFKYKPLRCSQPLMKLNMPRGITTSLSGFAANGITHCVRPEDVTQRRAVIMLRRVHPSAPRLLPMESYVGLKRIHNNNVNINGSSVIMSAEYFRKCYLTLQKYWRCHNKFGRIFKRCDRRKLSFRNTRYYAVGSYIIN